MHHTVTDVPHCDRCTTLCTTRESAEGHSPAPEQVLGPEAMWPYYPTGQARVHGHSWTTPNPCLL
eukprot:963371-Pelagomonas_calceolata.AAC.1